MIQATASAKRHPVFASRQQPGEFKNCTTPPSVHLIMRTRHILKNRLASLDTLEDAHAVLAALICYFLR